MENKYYYNNLVKLGEDKFRIFNVGNPIYTSIKKIKKISKKELYSYLKIKINKKFIVLIKHPLSSEVNQSSIQMKNTLTAVSNFCKEFNFYCICITPNSDPGSKKINEIRENFAKDKNILFFETLPRNIFVNLIRHCEALVGNSSMGILEAPYYKLPVVNIGNRQKGRLNAGNVDFVDYSKDNIYASLQKAVFDKSYRKIVKALINPYGDGDADLKIVDFLKNIDLNDKDWLIKRKIFKFARKDLQKYLFDLGESFFY